MIVPQDVYDAASAAYALSVERGDSRCVRNAIDAAYPLIRDHDLEEFLQGSGTRHSGLESRIRKDQVKRIVNIITNLQNKTASTGVGTWNSGYEAAIDDMLLALKL